MAITQHGQESRCRWSNLQLFDDFVGRTPAIHQDQAFKSSKALACLFHSTSSAGDARNPLASLLRPDHDESIGIAIGQWFEESSVDDAEYRRDSWQRCRARA